MQSLFLRNLINFIKQSLGRDYESRKRSTREKNELMQQKKVGRIQVEHELDLLKIKYSEQLIRIKEREARTTQDYKEFLDMIDEMKIQIVTAYPEMPKVMALVIHQHAKQLIDDMWNNPDEKMQNQCRVNLAKFIKVVFDDTEQVLINSEPSRIPTKTLDLIERIE